MQQNTASRDLSFSTAEMRELNDSLASITIQGQRLPDFVQVFSDVAAPEKL
jgi:hypothetical protein